MVGTSEQAVVLKGYDFSTYPQIDSADLQVGCRVGLQTGCTDSVDAANTASLEVGAVILN